MIEVATEEETIVKQKERERKKTIERNCESGDIVILL